MVGLNIPVRDELKFPIGIGISQSIEVLDEPPNLATLDQGNFVPSL